MSDILERLRNPPFGMETSDRLLLEAAMTEIERLQKELMDARAKTIEECAKLCDARVQRLLEMYGKDATPECAELDMIAKAIRSLDEGGKPSAKCSCARCWEAAHPTAQDHICIPMILCSICGNKRCPHATDHRNACTGSNEPGQPGSDYRLGQPDDVAELERRLRAILNSNGGGKP